LPRKRKSDESAVSEYVNVTFSIPYSLLSMFDGEIAKRGYGRSEALRMAMREMLERWTGRRL
jgi:metal-responsive CopG/Arc/MetJ family transcriptional regulator